MADKQGFDGGLRELALFAGAGGGILGGHLLGWRTVCAVEVEPYCASVLVARQNDGLVPAFPVWDDVRTFDGTLWRGVVDVISGGFPCQDISAAGKGAGIDGARSGLWREFARIICEVRPRFVFVENSPMLTGRGLGRVLGDLAALGFDAEWGVLSAAAVGAPHLRERIWILAYAQCDRLSLGRRVGAARATNNESRGICGDVGSRSAQQTRAGMADAMRCDGEWIERGCADSNIGQEPIERQARLRGGERWKAWPAEPAVGRLAHGVAHRVGRIKALGNGQVPRVAATAWRLLAARAGIDA